MSQSFEFGVRQVKFLTPVGNSTNNGQNLHDPTIQIKMQIKEERKQHQFSPFVGYINKKRKYDEIDDCNARDNNKDLMFQIPPCKKQIHENDIVNKLNKINAPQNGCQIQSQLRKKRSLNDCIQQTHSMDEFNAIENNENHNHLNIPIKRRKTNVCHNFDSEIMKNSQQMEIEKSSVSQNEERNNHSLNLIEFMLQSKQKNGNNISINFHSEYVKDVYFRPPINKLLQMMHNNHQTQTCNPENTCDQSTSKEDKKEKKTNEHIAKTPLLMQSSNRMLQLLPPDHCIDNHCDPNATGSNNDKNMEDQTHYNEHLKKNGKNDNNYECSMDCD